MTKCVLIRPGQTDYDCQKRVSGSLDLPLNSDGVAEVSRIAVAVKELDPEVIYTGDQEPALSTAKSIGESMGISVKTLNLSNVDHGLWQGLLFEDIRLKQPKLYKKWVDSPESVTPPNGESVEEATARVEKAVRKIRKKHDVFAVVAAEPMATLIESVLRGEDPKLCGPDVNREQSPLVDLIPLAVAVNSGP